MKKMPPEEKIFLGLIIFQIILMMCAIKFMTGAARPPKQMEGDYMRGSYKYDISQEDMDLIYRVVMSEAGGDGVLSQKGVVTVILNRLFSPRYPDSIPEIIDGQFSTADNGEPTEQVRRSVNIAIIEYGTKRQILPYQCYYFRAWDYHNFGIPYCQLGNNYFSLSEEATD